MKVLVSMVLALMAVGYAGLCGMLYANQDLLMYPGAADSNPPGYESFRVQSGVATLKVWSLHTDEEPALLYFGGNGEDVGANLPAFEVPRQCVVLGGRTARREKQDTNQNPRDAAHRVLG